MSEPFNTTIPDNRVVRFRDACVEAGVSVATMRRYLSAGRGPRLVRVVSQAVV